MARPPRLEPAGVAQHVVQRGNNRAACFFEDIDRLFYLKCLAEASSRRGCAVHAYVLMTNHVHLLVTPATSGAVSQMMQDLGRMYVTVVNKAHGRTGTLWEGRFKSHLIDSENYLMTCHRYIELNPVRAGIAEHPEGYPWSSHAHYASGSHNALITEHEVYRRLGSTSAARRSAFAALLAQQIDDSEVESLRRAINGGRAVGSKQFLDTMESILGRSVRPALRGRPRKESGHQQCSDQQSEMLL